MATVTGSEAARQVSPLVQVNPLELESGCRARIHGLVSAPQHNGKEGTLLHFDNETLRWGIKIGEERLSVKPANLLRQRKYSQQRNRSWALHIPCVDHYEWLCDCYRLRMDDVYSFSGDCRGLYSSSGPAAVAQEFFAFCKLVMRCGALPDSSLPWDWPAFLTQAAGMLVLAFEKSDGMLPLTIAAARTCAGNFPAAQERWGSISVDRLRSTAMYIYGKSLTLLNADECSPQEQKALQFAQRVLPPNTRPRLLTTRRQNRDNAIFAGCLDVGGLDAWTQFYQLLAVNMRHDDDDDDHYDDDDDDFDDDDNDDDDDDDYAYDDDDDDGDEGGGSSHTDEEDQEHFDHHSSVSDSAASVSHTTQPILKAEAKAAPILQDDARAVDMFISGVKGRHYVINGLYSLTQETGQDGRMLYRKCGELGDQALCIESFEGRWQIKYQSDRGSGACLAYCEGGCALQDCRSRTWKLAEGGDFVDEPRVKMATAADAD
jgi:hypothetical protein